MKIGVLALQGDFEAHIQKLRSYGVEAVEVRAAEDLYDLSGLVIPGGESTTLLKLAKPELRRQIADAIRDGLPTLATCAGLIMLANRVSNPTQESLAVLDAGVSRNGYGRQINSFIEPSLDLSELGKAELSAALERFPYKGNVSDRPDDVSKFEGVFIRAPRITDVGAGVKILAARGGEPVLVREKNVLAGTFHPELSSGPSPVHQLFLGMIHARSEH